jgi:hypothetical protein
MCVSCTLPDDLVAAAGQVVDRRAPYVNQTAEREQQENRQAQRQVRFENEPLVGNVACRISLSDPTARGWQDV